ncbi:MAG: hypothetical protein JW726_03285 [Anaerolineales bacterium]|nr:hypothetical protein [Anaerolineales bacterium]
MRHPIERIEPEQRTKYFIPLLVGTLLLMAVMNWIGAPLNTAAAPYGIVSFEFATTAHNAQAILESWGAPGQIRAAFIQGLDFIFPLVYSSAIGLGCLLAGSVLQRRRWPLAGLGNGLAWGLWQAAGFDYVENIALTALLFGIGGSGWAMLSAVCALVKFLLIFIGMVYALYGLVIRLVIAKPVR